MLRTVLLLDWRRLMRDSLLWKPTRAKGRQPGHASMRAALIYQHATADRDQAIAAALSRLATGDVTVAEQDGRAGPPLHAQGRARPRVTGT